MKIATFNVNGINGRLPILLRWLLETSPDVVCLQELKAPQEKFPEAAIRDAGYGAISHGQKSWNGVAILTRGADPIETRRELPGDPDDNHSRYIEAAIDGLVVGCLYLPNGNPAPGPKFDYKLRWFERLTSYAAELLALGAPVVLAGDFNVMPTDLDVYKPERWVDDALFRPEVREAFHRLVAQGWTDAIRVLHPDERIYTFWDYFRNAWGRNAGLRIDHFLLSPSIADRLVAGGVDREVRGWEKASDHAPAGAVGQSQGPRQGHEKLRRRLYEGDEPESDRLAQRKAQEDFEARRRGDATRQQRRARRQELNPVCRHFDAGARAAGSGRARHADDHCAAQQRARERIGGRESQDPHRLGDAQRRRDAGQGASGRSTC
jgi:exodeoxyribonuclease-3